MPPLLLPANLVALLQALTAPAADGAPHSAFIASRAAGNQVLVAHSQPTLPPWPPVRPSPEEVDHDERAAMYAALAGGAWEAQQGAQHNDGEGGEAHEGEPLMLNSELGRIAVVGLGAFLLVLVGTEVAPWKVLDKKIRAAAEQLRKPLERVGA
ncbi:hypothetical protein JCM10450v2_002618 [Rhodotorula kratochvilovae]